MLNDFVSKWCILLFQAIPRQWVEEIDLIKFDKVKTLFRKHFLVYLCQSIHHGEIRK